ncbi:hypothetical protein [Catellatospora chokoriensis]|uniref:Capsular polysaccharide biosynthesis protein n=1 Tax=Catellatospora chokoriensis TaxID=310353 RepID=A0A8J3JUS7_9ACTN|nr:hypothetical protein [Catellatospora chokoriensis]GIF87203.1 hypothetical protein Cch02nite_06470 [Catellatospora chokoriensis]
MDFWDLTKLLVRRWRVAVPMVLLTLGLTVFTFIIVKPDYVALSYVQLVPPAARTRVGQPGPEQRNPWLNQGLQTLGNAAVISVIDQSLRDDLKKRGFSDSYTVEMFGSSTMITIEVVGDTKAQANDTAAQIVSKIEQSVQTLQTAYGVGATDLITARRLDPGTNADAANSNVKRAIIAVAAAGLMLSAGVTVAVDAVLRTRARRRNRAPGTTTGDDGDPHAGAPTANGTPPPMPNRAGPALTMPSAGKRANGPRDDIAVVYQPTNGTARTLPDAGNDTTAILPKLAAVNGKDVPHPAERRSPQ